MGRSVIEGRCENLAPKRLVPSTLALQSSSRGSIAWQPLLLLGCTSS